MFLLLPFSLFDIEYKILVPIFRSFQADSTVFLKDGSLIVCPILDSRRSAYGTLAVDTLRTQNKENRIFLQHELAFVQVSLNKVFTGNLVFLFSFTNGYVVSSTSNIVLLYKYSENRDRPPLKILPSIGCRININQRM